MKYRNQYLIAFHSAAFEFDWICGSSAYWASLYSQIQFFGVLLGTIITGTLSDIFGRRPLALISLSCGIIISFCSGFFLSLIILNFNILQLRKKTTENSSKN
ncbi:unnamed protein product [Onchocerca flexuosa]|uniref:MFS domain-containing protein n=1 Tax=Onchocerca flexuosa TaxID=387005 RepID=A0A183HTH3_9BILA|nr:unnamed protein product [Onchocerca flexuosa]